MDDNLINEIKTNMYIASLEDDIKTYKHNLDIANIKIKILNEELNSLKSTNSNISTLDPNEKKEDINNKSFKDCIIKNLNTELEETKKSHIIELQQIEQKNRYNYILFNILLFILIFSISFEIIVY